MNIDEMLHVTRSVVISTLTKFFIGKSFSLCNSYTKVYEPDPPFIPLLYHSYITFYKKKSLLSSMSNVFKLLSRNELRGITDALEDEILVGVLV